MKRSTRAFTLVELIIVIAVIGVLAAILIPTFANVIDKANVASKTSLARNLNSLLATEEVNNGMARTGSMGEAISVAREHGYTMTELDDETAGEIVFVDGRFAVLDKNGEVAYSETGEVLSTDKHKMFKAYTEMPEEQTYGIYMAGEMSGDVTVSTSFDAGENQDLNINFATDEEGTFTIVSKAGNVTVNAPHATVNHYGFADMVDIVAVANESYHEFGFVTYAQIAWGRFVAEVGAQISSLVITGTPVTVADMTTNCAACKIYVKEGVSTEGISYINSMPIVGGTLTMAQMETMMTTATMFGGGSGTEDDPFIIVSRRHLENITARWNAWVAYDYFKVSPSIKSIDCSHWTPLKMLGLGFDGSGVTFKNLDNALFNYAYLGYNGLYEVVFENFTVEANMVLSAPGGVVLNTTPDSAVTFRNVNVKGYAEAPGIAGYIGYGLANWTYPEYYDQTFTFENCRNEATLVASASGQGGCCGFILNPFCTKSTATEQHSKLIIKDSMFVGRMSAPATSQMYYFHGNPSYTLAVKEQYTNPSSVYGVLHGDPQAAGATRFADGSYLEVTGATGWNVKYLPEIRKSVLAMETGTVPAKYATFTADAGVGAVKATATLTITRNAASNSTGGFPMVVLRENITVDGNAFTTSKIKNYDITINGNSTTNTGISSDGHTFNLIDDWAASTPAGASVRIVQYDTNGNIVKITNFKIL